MAKLTPKQFDAAIKEYYGGHELVNIMVRFGGDKEDYQRAYERVKFGKRPK